MLDPMHRDDMDFEDAEELIAQMKEQFGDHIQVVFAGDVASEIPAAVMEQIAEIERHMLESLAHGVCVDCGKGYPLPWPPTVGDEMAEGWSRLADTREPDKTLAIECDDCRDGASKKVFGVAE